MAFRGIALARRRAASALSAVGLRTVQEAGDVGDWSRKQIELLTMQHLLVYDVEPEVEYMFMDSAFATEGGCEPFWKSFT